MLADPASTARPGRGLTVRLLAWQFLDEAMPFFAVYALLFADAGLSDRAISLLFILWSSAAILAEVPSGALADLISRKLLLAVATVLYGGCFAAWVLVPNVWGFATGFLLWAVSGALASGTFTAFAYDELAAAGQPGAFGRVVSWGGALSLVAVTLATLVAAPLFAVGGYQLVGWVSVGVCGLQLLLVLSLPRTPRSVSAADVDELEEDEDAVVAPPAPVTLGQALRTWAATMRDGLAVARRDRVLRGGVLASAVLMGLLAFDEYFGLLLRGQGVSTQDIPLLLTAIAAGQAAGSLLAESAQHLPRVVLGALVAGAGVAMAAGALVPHPAGVVAVAAGYGTVTLLIVVSEIRLQEVAPTQLRATVTSVSNLLAELLAVAIYAVFVLGAAAGIAVLIGVLSLGLVLLALPVARWLPVPSSP